MGASGRRTGRSSGRGRGQGASGEQAWTVRDVLAAPSLVGARLLAGAAGLDRVVERLNVMEVPDVVPWTAPNELLLTTGYPLRDDPEQLVPLIGELDRVGLAGLGVKVGRFLAEVPAAAAVRYAWQAWVEPAVTLQNSEGLPAEPREIRVSSSP
jgi:hypothetical protein